MSTLPTKSFAAIVGSISAGMQGRITNRFLNFAIGTVLRGVAEAYAGVALWLQYFGLQIAKLTRLATSYGSDVDSFVADFPLAGTTRLAFQAATGLCTFSRNTAGPFSVYVPVGGQAKSADGTLVFQVYADTTNAAYNPLLGTAGGYAIAASTNSITAPVICITPSLNSSSTAPASGANGNVAAGQISLISSNILGVDTVTNSAALTNGLDAESDASVKTRFLLAVQGRGGGTVAAITSAIANLKVGMQSTIQIGANLDGSSNPGMVSVVIDDGSGAVPGAVLAAAQAAIGDNVIGIRAAGISTGVYAASIVLANVVMVIATLPGYVHATVVAQVIAAIGLKINGTGLGNTLKYSQVYATAQAVSGVDEITTFTINSAALDIAGTPRTTIKAGSLVVS